MNRSVSTLVLWHYAAQFQAPKGASLVLFSTIQPRWSLNSVLTLNVLVANAIRSEAGRDSP
jgi:hypothetical protein